MTQQTTSDVIAACAKDREAAKERPYTVADAIADAQWIERTPDGVLAPHVAKKCIVTLLAALQASPCYFKAAQRGLPSFTFLPYDKAGHVAITVWATHAESHGCAPEKVAEARAKVREWAQRPDCKWPD